MDNSKNQKECYTYTRNQPKNTPQILLSAENYGYSYALYKPEKHQNQPSQKEEKKWPGVV